MSIIKASMLIQGGQSLGPVTYVAASAVAQASIGGATKLTISTPSGAVAGDLLIAFIATTTGSAQTFSGDSARWSSALFNGQYGAGNIAAFWAIHDGTTSSWDFTYSGTGKASAGAIVAYRGAAYDVVGTPVTATPASSITLSQANSVALFVGYNTNNSTTITATGYSSLVTDSDATTPSIAILSKSYSSAGATGTVAFSNANAGALIGIKPG